MVDDHPMIIEGYKNALLRDNSSIFSIDIAHDCDTALLKIGSSSDEPYDIVFLDIRITPCKDGKIISGEGLGMYLREKFPGTKTIVLTMFSDKSRLFNILKNVNPEGFLIKSDVTPKELQNAVKSVLNGTRFYSKTVQELMTSQKKSHPLLDDYDFRILFHLSNGTKTKDLIDFVPLSLGAIEKRKRKIKEVFDISLGGDKEIIDRARELGFL